MDVHPAFQVTNSWLWVISRSSSLFRRKCWWYQQMSSDQQSSHVHWGVVTMKMTLKSWVTTIKLLYPWVMRTVAYNLYRNWSLLSMLSGKLHERMFSFNLLQLRISKRYHGVKCYILNVGLNLEHNNATILSELNQCMLWTYFAPSSSHVYEAVLIVHVGCRSHNNNCQQSQLERMSVVSQFLCGRIHPHQRILLLTEPHMQVCGMFGN